jgi:hypothetical protein
MHRCHNTLKCLNIVLSILSNSCNIRSTVKDSLSIKVSTRNKGLVIKGYKVNSSIKCTSCVLNKPLLINCNIICTTNKGSFDDKYMYLQCKSGIVCTKDNKPIYILK